MPILRCDYSPVASIFVHHRVEYLYFNPGAGLRGLRSPRSLYFVKTHYYRTQLPIEPLWPPRCHQASQNDFRTLKRGCSSFPRSHQCTPKWHSELPQSRILPPRGAARDHLRTISAFKSAAQACSEPPKHAKARPKLAAQRRNCSMQLRGRFVIECAARTLCFCFCVRSVFVLVLFGFACVSFVVK